jgi:hypothetical protein
VILTNKNKKERKKQTNKQTASYLGEFGLKYRPQKPVIVTVKMISLDPSRLSAGIVP